METLKSFFNAGLVRQARLLAAMTSSLRLNLPPDVAEHCWVGGINDRLLVVVTDSASFAVAAYYQQHEILKRINSDFQAELPAPLIKLRTKVATLSPTISRSLPRPTLSTSNARGLESAAATINDPELKIALTRLARRGSNRKPS